MFCICDNHFVDAMIFFIAGTTFFLASAFRLLIFDDVFVTGTGLFFQCNRRIFFFQSKHECNVYRLKLS